MKKIILTTAAAAVCFGATATAKDDAAAEIILTQPMKMGDARLSCDQLVEEASNMEVVLGGSPAGGLMDGEQMANIGTSLAQHAALRAGGGVAAGAIGQVGGLFGRSSKKKKEEEAMRKAIAEKRWIYMVGLYEGRNCDAQPAATAVAEDVAAPATE
ncbi:hypothetical protein PUV54_06100 [Hyphococcus flavus]|uniref:Glycine zipper family protein n=1 Tax=Hyphococcus flavus TaxID=1866326 RepID=A0AAE9ZHM7_9PROT|nr:hypothetical protein [Hyphococcus flavus]WDI32767.1 hypothetical protein PUV54_06100 [Hyphococcus flavus]